MPSLDELRRVIRRIEGARPPRPAADPVEQVDDGELLDTGQGTIVVVRRDYALTHRHGAEPLGDATAAPLEMLARAARIDAELGDAGWVEWLEGRANCDGSGVRVRAGDHGEGSAGALHL